MFRSRKSRDIPPGGQALARASAAEALDAGLRAPDLAPFRAAAAGRAGLPGDLLEIHGATPARRPGASPWARTGTEWDLATNVGALIGSIGGDQVCLRHRDVDGKRGPTIVTAPQAQIDALMRHARANPVGLAAILLVQRVNATEPVGFVGWFWHELGGKGHSDGMYAMRTGSGLIYAMRLGPGGATLFAFHEGRAAQEPMASLSKSALARAITEHAPVTDDGPYTPGGPQ